MRIEHTYCFGGTPSQALKDASHNAMIELGKQTKYFRNYMSSCTDKTDITFRSNSAISARGDYKCEKKNIWGNCEAARIRLNPTLLTNKVNREKTACHEVGHSGGLSHGGSAGCMINGAVSSTTTHYRAHHITHLDDRE